METIHVPKPPSQAFNKDRPISDLIKAQIKHLKHLEDKLPASVRASLPQHAIVSESDAARYIAPMTQLLRSQSTAPDMATMVPKAATLPIPIRSARPLSLAAAASPGQDKPVTKSAAAAPKRATSRSSKRGEPSAKGKK